MKNQPISKPHFAPVRKLALAAICISSWCVPLEAQQRTLSENSGQPIPAPTSSHRWLPLPSRDGSGLPDFASLYDRFKQHVESKQEGEGGRPPVDLQQIEALKEMLSQMGGKLPDGTPLPNLDTIPPELLSKAMQDPALQRQAQDCWSSLQRTANSRPAIVEVQGCKEVKVSYSDSWSKRCRVARS